MVGRVVMSTVAGVRQKFRSLSQRPKGRRPSLNSPVRVPIQAPPRRQVESVLEAYEGLTDGCDQRRS
jgi:hypothetical protein